MAPSKPCLLLLMPLGCLLPCPTEGGRCADVVPPRTLPYSSFFIGSFALEKASCHAESILRQSLETNMARKESLLHGQHQYVPDV